MGGGVSRSEFRASVLRLIKEEVASTEDEFWKKICTGTGDLDDVFGTIHSNDVREFLKAQPQNVTTLFHKLVEHLEANLNELDIIQPMRSVKQFYSLVGIIRLFQRLVPFIYETDVDGNFATSLFWAKPENSDDQKTLGTRIVAILMRMLFVPPHTCNQFQGKVFVVPENSSFNLPQENIWEKGIDVEKSRGSSATQDRYRADVLRSILVFCSKPMYVEGRDALYEKGNRFQSEFVSSATPYTREMFVSMMNVIFSYSPVSWIPYTNVLTNDYRESLVHSCLHVLLVFLEEVGAKAEDNVFISYFKNVIWKKELDFIWTGYVRLIQNPMYIASLYMPSSRKELSCIPELLILFWKLIDLNKAFVQFIVSADKKISEIVVPFGYLMLQARNDESMIGQVFIITFIFLALSGERDFCIHLNERFFSNVKMDIPIFYHGNLFDFLFLVLQKIIIDGHGRLFSLYESFFTIIANVSPYIKSSSMITASKFLKLLESFSQEKFIFSYANSYIYMNFLLEALQNILQYQYEGNTHIVYEILTHSSFFRRLSNLNFENGYRTWKEELKAVNGMQQITDQSDSQSADIASTEKTLVDKDGKYTKVAEKEGEERDEEAENGAEGGEEEEIVPKEEEVLEGEEDEENGDSSEDSKGEAGAELFVPTKEWFESWFGSIKPPLSIVLRVVDALYPQVDEYCLKNVPDENAITRFIKNYTLVGLLPVPHKILIRKYQKNPGTMYWITTYMWGITYLRNSSPAIFYGSEVALFKVTLAT